MLRSTKTVVSTFAELAEIMDRSPVNRFHLWTLALSFAVVMSDGYDLAVVGVVAPPLLAEFRISPMQIGWLFSGGLTGMVLGAMLFSFVGDRYGRKVGVVIATFMVGGFTLASAFSDTIWQLVALRFLTGIGLAAIIPNLVALNAEFLPAKVRSLFLGIVLIGVPVGASMAALTSGMLLPAHGWRSLMVIGGGWPLLLCVVVALGMPESVKYLALRPGQLPRIARLLAKIYGSQLDIDVSRLRPVLSKHDHIDISPSPLLAPQYRSITLALWLLCFLNYGVVYFFASWMPMALTSSGFKPSQVGFLVSLGPIGGIFGSLVVSALIRRWGMLLLVALFCIGIPVSVVLGSGSLTFSVAAVFCFLSGCCTVGCQTGLIISSGLLYTTEVRARGTGWGAGVGRLGSVLAPLVGSALATQLPVQRLLLVPAAPLVVCLLVSGFLTALCYQRYAGIRLPDVETIEPSRKRAPLEAVTDQPVL
jgi:AAHS family 4-hydroxybenzoate transporter-like MFS transporter